MKNLLIGICAMCLANVAACANDDVTVKYADTPASVHEFMAKHFAGEKIKCVTMDRDDVVADYDIYLLNGTKVEIDANGSWSEVSSRTAAVPVTMLPAATQNYLATNYAGQKVVKVDKDRKGYEVRLANGTELEFDQQGAFVKIDR